MCPKVREVPGIGTSVRNSPPLRWFGLGRLHVNIAPRSRTGISRIYVMGFEQLLDALGLARAYAPAAAIYGVFLWLDRKASQAARAGFAKWTRGEQRDQLDLTSLAVGAFDHLYGYPLLSLRAFGRCALISIVLWFTWFLPIELYRHDVVNAFYDIFVDNRLGQRSASTITFFVVLFINIISDYISLFFVRKCLTYTARNIIFSLLLSLIVGVIIIFIAYTAAYRAQMSIRFGTAFFGLTLNDLQEELGYLLYYDPVKLTLSPAAFFVHLWLPIFAIGALLLRALQIHRYLTGRAQWFMADGDSHPIEAAGAVVAGLTFVGAAATQIVSRILS
jgi:hypothetical protein